MLQAKRESQVTFLQSELLRRIPSVVHAFSTRRAETDGFSLGPISSPNPMIQINRARFLAAVGAPGWPILKLRQVHSGIVCDMDDTMAAGDAIEGDAAITDLRGALLGVQTADCVPILITDEQGRVAAAVHAGWRGTAQRIVERTVNRLKEKYGVSPSELLAAVGPHVGVCCYEVGEEVVEAIADSQAVARPPAGKPRLNLGVATVNQLLRAGLLQQRIELSSLCTRCRADLFFSYRREGDRAGRLLSVIGLAP